MVISKIDSALTLLNTTIASGKGYYEAESIVLKKYKILTDDLLNAYHEQAGKINSLSSARLKVKHSNRNNQIGPYSHKQTAFNRKMNQLIEIEYDE